VPIYEYRCLECGFQDEYLQKITEPQLTVCPTCGKESFRKLVSAAGFQLKGSGWYATDFKNSGSKPGKSGGETKPSAEAKPEGKSESGESKSAESKSAESKSESKSETKNEPAAA
jgi:putative FmdB family regulatory protein